MAWLSRLFGTAPAEVDPSSPIGRFPIPQRRPGADEYHVVWQSYLHSESDYEAIAQARQLLVTEHATQQFGIIDADDNMVTVDGQHVYPEWRLSDRLTTTGEYMVLWNIYLTADDHLDAVARACQLIQGGHEPAAMVVCRNPS